MKRKEPKKFLMNLWVNVEEIRELHKKRKIREAPSKCKDFINQNQNVFNNCKNKLDKFIVVANIFDNFL